MDIRKEYANGFAITTNAQTGEACITLLETRPVFNTEINEFAPELVGSENIIMPYNILKELGKAINDCVANNEKESNANEK